MSLCDRLSQLDLTYRNAITTMARQTKGKYEEPHPPHCLGTIDLHSCAGDAPFVRSKVRPDVKGTGHSTTAQPYAATKRKNPSYSCRRSAKSERDQERQFAFENSESPTNQGDSSANGPADESNFIPSAV